MIKSIIAYLQAILQSRLETHKAKAEARQIEVQVTKQSFENYSDILDRLKDAREYMEQRADYYRKELDERRNETNELRDKVNALESRINILIPQVCIKVRCKARRLPAAEKSVEFRV